MVKKYVRLTISASSKSSDIKDIHLYDDLSHAINPIPESQGKISKEYLIKMEPEIRRYYINVCPNPRKDIEVCDFSLIRSSL